MIVREAVHGAASPAPSHWTIRKEVKANLDDTVRCQPDSVSSSTPAKKVSGG